MNEMISVLMPAYNRERYIGTAIESILQQTHKNLQLIIYDDGSTDRTCELINYYAEQDKRIKVIGGEINHGAAYARNRLLEATNTKIAAIMDSDDVSNIYRLEIQLESLLRSGAPGVFTGRMDFWEPDFDREVIQSGLWKKRPPISRGGPPAQASIMFRVKYAGRYDETRNLGREDLFWGQDMKKQYGKISTIPQRLYYWRCHKNQMSTWNIVLRGLIGTEIERNSTYGELIEKYRDRQSECDLIEQRKHR